MENVSVRFSIISDSLHRTTEQSFLTGRPFFLGERLFMNKRIAVGVGAAEIFRRGVATHVAVDAGRIDVVSTRHVFLYAFVSIRQASSYRLQALSAEHYPQSIRRLHRFLKSIGQEVFRCSIIFGICVICGYMRSTGASSLQA